MIESIDSLYCDEKENLLIGGAGSLYIPMTVRHGEGRRKPQGLPKGPVACTQTHASNNEPWPKPDWGRLVSALEPMRRERLVRHVGEVIQGTIEVGRVKGE